MFRVAAQNLWGKNQIEFDCFYLDHKLRNFRLGSLGEGAREIMAQQGGTVVALAQCSLESPAGAAGAETSMYFRKVSPDQTSSESSCSGH
jgi:acetyl-CoA acetyltransferase